MDVRDVSSGFAVAPQIRPEDVRQLADRGFVALICNRPDGEEPGQPDVAEMREAAERAGLAFHHVPVSGGAFPDPAVAAFAAIRRGTKGAVLAYCRTGTRSVTLDALANPENLPAATLVANAAAAGYDLSAMSERLG